MRRITVTLALVLAVLAAPAALSAYGPSSDPDGAPATTSSCDGEDCGDYGPTTDPDGLAARPDAPGRSTPFLDWLRGLLAL
jgi:hypothetical protein